METITIKFRKKIGFLRKIETRIIAKVDSNKSGKKFIRFYITVNKNKYFSIKNKFNKTHTYFIQDDSFKSLAFDRETLNFSLVYPERVDLINLTKIIGIVKRLHATDLKFNIDNRYLV